MSDNSYKAMEELEKVYSNTPESEWKTLFKIPYILLLPSACVQSSQVVQAQQGCHGKG